VGVGTVAAYCRRARQAGLEWPVPAEWDDAQLEARLFQRVGDLVGVPRPMPDMAALHQELKRPGVTLQRLHLEYLARHRDGYRYSQFCRHYHEWVRTLHPTMRQVHRAGEKVFVDFSGKRPVQRLDADRCLLGFPRPSGSNGHRGPQYRQMQARMRALANAWLFPPAFRPRALVRIPGDRDRPEQARQSRTCASRHRMQCLAEFTRGSHATAHGRSGGRLDRCRIWTFGRGRRDVRVLERVDVQGPHRTFRVRPFANEERAHWTLRVRYPARSGARLVSHRTGAGDGKFLEHPVEIGVQAHDPARRCKVCAGEVTSGR
jgi:hypothetical protein